MAYIGVSPSNGTRRVHTYTATASQTTFSGAGAEGSTLSYKDSNFVDVYQNGVKLGDADYTATSGTSIVLGTGATVSDLVVIVVYDVFSVADTVSKADGGTFDGNVTMAGTLGVTGASTLTGALSAKGGAVFNEDSADVDFRVESNGDANMLFVDGGNDRIGIGTNSPQKLLHLKDGDIVVGNGTASNNAVIGRVGFSTDASNSRFIGIESFRGGDAANGDLRFHTFGGDGDNGERVRIHTNGVLSASDGIALGVGTANTASNVLDDYEEGTWTPALTGLTLSTALGNYTKIGQIVHWGFRVILPTTTANTHFNVTGLPFSHNLSSDFRFGGALIYANSNIGADVTCIVVNNGVQFYKNGSSFVEYGDYNGSDVRASGAYITTD